MPKSMNYLKKSEREKKSKGYTKSTCTSTDHEEESAKFQNDWLKTVAGIVLTSYPWSVH